MSRSTPPLPILLTFSRAFRLTPLSSPLRPQLFCHWTNCRADFLCICHPLFSSVACSVCRSISLWNWNVTNFFLRRNEEMSTRPLQYEFTWHLHVTWLSARAHCWNWYHNDITSYHLYNCLRWKLGDSIYQVELMAEIIILNPHCACLHSVSHSKSVITTTNRTAVQQVLFFWSVGTHILYSKLVEGMRCIFKISHQYQYGIWNWSSNHNSMNCDSPTQRQKQTISFCVVMAVIVKCRDQFATYKVSLNCHSWAVCKSVRPPVVYRDGTASFECLK